LDNEVKISFDRNEFVIDSKMVCVCAWICGGFVFVDVEGSSKDIIGDN